MALLYIGRVTEEQKTYDANHVLANNVLANNVLANNVLVSDVPAHGLAVYSPVSRRPRCGKFVSRPFVFFLFAMGAIGSGMGCGRIGFEERDTTESASEAIVWNDTNDFQDETTSTDTPQTGDSVNTEMDGSDTAQGLDSGDVDTSSADTNTFQDADATDNDTDHATDSAAASSSGAARIPNSKALALNGDDAFVSFGDVTIPSGTISFWIKTTAASGYVFSRESSDAATSGDGTIALDEGRLTCRMVDSDIHEISSVNAINDNEWHHVALVFQPGMMLVVDGSVQPASDDTLSTGFEAAGAMLVVGRNDKNDDDYLWAMIDEFATHDRHLLESEIEEIYNEQRPTNLSAIPTAGALTHWWRMGDGDTAPRISDKTGNATGIMMNMDGEAFVSDTP